MDTALLEMLPAPGGEARMHSETPGMIVDRLSFMALKEYHMEETHRTTATEAHRRLCGQKLACLRQRREDLGTCLEYLAAELLAGRRYFKLYRQLKLYNDPDLNPQLRLSVAIGSRRPR